MARTASLLRAALLAAALLVAGGHAAAATAVQEWQAAYDRAQAAYAAGELDAAERAARDALARARAGGGASPSYVASSLNTLALILQARGQPGAAADLLTEALAASEASLGVHLNTASVAWNLGGALEQAGQPRAALAQYRRCLAIADALPADAAVLELRRKAVLALGRLLDAEGEHAEARRLLRRLQPGAGGGEGASPALRAEALRQQAVGLEAQGDYEEAARALEAALALREAELGPDDPALVPVLSALARLRGRQGRPDLAAPLHRRAVAILERGDPQSPALAEHLNELGLWQAGRGAHAEAAALFERAQALVEAHAGAAADGGLALAHIVFSRAQMAAALDDGEQAQALYRRAEALYAGAGDGPQALVGQADALNGQAALVYRRRRLREAEPLFLKALALMERATGEDDARLLPLLDNLVALYRSKGEEAAARPYAQRAQALRRQQAAARLEGQGPGTAPQ